MSMLVEANGLKFAVEMSGEGEPLLLIMGLGGQLTDWPPGFVTGLERYFTVIRFDNRDSGLSSHWEGAAPRRWEIIRSSLLPGAAPPPYTLGDMADDAAAVLTALDLDGAHIVGMSMGAMIAQHLTINRPDLVWSLASMMSSTGDRRHGHPTPRVLAALARRGQPSASDAIQASLDLFSLVGGSDWDPVEQQRRTSASVARSYNPAGILRQTQAVAAAGDRTARLGSVRAPTLVVHGLEDSLIRPSGGIATARAVPHSRLLMFPRMGHDLPATRHDELVEAIVNNSDRV